MPTTQKSVEKITTLTHALRRFWNQTCSWFALVTLAVLLLQYLPGTDQSEAILIPHRFLLLFPFSAVMGGLGTLTGTGMRRCFYLPLHFFGFLLGFYLFLILPTRNLQTGSGRFLLIIAVSLVYWLVRLCIFGLSRLFIKKANDNSDYRDLYR